MNSRRLWMIGCAAALAAAAAWAQLQKGEAFTGFRVPDYDEQGQLKMLVQGEKAWIVADDEIEIQNFQIETYQNGVVDARVTSPHCFFNNGSRKARSTNDIRIVRGVMTISGTGYNWDPEPQVFEIHSNARVVFRGSKEAIRRSSKPQGELR